MMEKPASKEWFEEWYKLKEATQNYYFDKI